MFYQINTKFDQISFWLFIFYFNQVQVRPESRLMTRTMKNRCEFVSKRRKSQIVTARKSCKRLPRREDAASGNRFASRARRPGLRASLTPYARRFRRDSSANFLVDRDFNNGAAVYRDRRSTRNVSVDTKNDEYGGTREVQHVFRRDDSKRLWRQALK